MPTPVSAEQQHGQVRGSHGVDLAQELPHRLAAAEQFARRAAARAQRLRHRLLARRARRHLLDRLRGLDAGLDHRDQRIELLRAHGLEAAGVERVERQQPPEPAAQPQRRAHAVVHRQQRGLAGYEAVVGIGQAAVVGEAQAAFALEQAREARMRGHRELAPQRLVAQAVHRQGPQHLAVEPQQRGRVAVHQAARGGQQGAEALGIGGRFDTLRGHKYNVWGVADLTTPEKSPTAAGTWRGGTGWHGT
ncbi:hypothetical protein M2165_000372 [Variovorax sp. TBS-050B]|nr:hypothetical protein [Variovorax sp. TBS-050B]MDH6590483.1 hypothetical protein [Variovorax sp. TBS-050B]